MTEPYLGTHLEGNPQLGTLFAHQHRVWRVVQVRAVPEVDWTDEQRRHAAAFAHPQAAVPGPVDIVAQPVQQDEEADEWRFRYLSSQHGTLAAFDDEHYPVCATCGEPMPCRDTLAARAARHALEVMERYTDPARCPRCGEVFGPRQHTRTFDTNLYLPGGPPVTFHTGRRECLYSASSYAGQLGTLTGENVAQQVLPYDDPEGEPGC